MHERDRKHGNTEVGGWCELRRPKKFEPDLGIYAVGKVLCLPSWSLTV